ncbi:MAG: glycosyltransferase [Anaerolineales bacterium]|nr:glycosyltransferase [Anaerolineales bacterium]
MPSISVILPTYNRAAFLPEAIQSVLSQSLTDLELIVVDDGSTDNTAAVIQPFLEDVRVRYLPQPNSGRVGQVRLAGARQARGERLAFLDSDDRYLPTALAAHLRVQAAEPQVGLTVGGYNYISAAGAWFGRRQPWLEGGALDLAGWLFNCYAMPGAVVVRRDWFERAGGFAPELHYAADWGLFLQLAAVGCPMAWVKTETCDYRLHAGNSIRQVAEHYADAQRALALLLARPNLPADIQAQAKAARAWAGVTFARKAQAAGNYARAQAWLAEALQLDPALAVEKRPHFLESWLTPVIEWPGAPDAYSRAAAEALPAALRPTPRELRRLLGRLAMSRFFQATARGDHAAARPALRAGLRHDPAWLANRGVLAYLARHGLGHKSA